MQNDELVLKVGDLGIARRGNGIVQGTSIGSGLYQAPEVDSGIKKS